MCNEHGHSAKYCPYGDQKGKGKGGGSQKGNIKGNAKGTNFNVKDKGKINNAKGSGPSAKGQQWGGQQWGSKGLPNTKVVKNSKVAKERSVEVAKRPHTSRYDALVRDDDEETKQSQRLDRAGSFGDGKDQSQTGREQAQQQVEQGAVRDNTSTTKTRTTT